MSSVLPTNSLPKILPKFQPTTTQLDASQFINQYNSVFSRKVFQMPHFATRSLHTVIGILLRDVQVYFGGSNIDLRNSSIVMQSSGAGKQPTIEFILEIVKHFGIDFRPRKMITSAGAVGTIVDGKEVPGDLKKLDLIVCAEGDSILYPQMDRFGGDLLTDLCISQDANNSITKRLAAGEIEPYTSKTSFFITTTVPVRINPRWVEKGLFQRFGMNIKDVEIPVYQGVRNEVVDKIGEKDDLSGDIEVLAAILTLKPIPKEFIFSKKIKEEIKAKAQVLDKVLIDFTKPYVKTTAKTFTIRRDLKMIVYACHHAFLDNRNEINSEDVNYAYNISSGSWQDILSFIGREPCTVKSCSQAILNLINNGADEETWNTEFLVPKLPDFTYENIKQQLSYLNARGEIQRIERGLYKKIIK